MRFGRGEVAWELRGVEADLVAGSIEGGGMRRRGFDGEQRRRSSTTVAELEGEGVLVGIGRREVARKPPLAVDTPSPTTLASIPSTQRCALNP